MKIAVCAAILATSMLAGCAGDNWGGRHGYEYQGRHWDRREKVCEVRPNGRKICTWRYY